MIKRSKTIGNCFNSGIIKLQHKPLTEKECEDIVKQLHKQNPEMYLSLKQWKKKRNEVKKRT